MAKIRGRNEGTIFYNEKKKLWVAQVSLPDGKRKAKYGKTQKEVRDWLLSIRQAQKQGLVIEQDRIKVSDFLSRYMADVAANTLKPKTLESYEYLIRMHIKPVLGDIRLAQLRPDMVQQLYTSKLNEGLSPRTVHYIHSILHKTLDQALKWGLVVRNVADLVDPPKVKKATPSIWTVEQSKRFLEQVKDSRFYPMYCLAFIGMREGEILGLHIEDFSAENHTITIRHALQYLMKKGLVLTEPKSEKGKRTIKLPDFVYEPLKKHRDSLKGNQGFMFTTGNGTPFSPRNFYRDFQAQSEAAGLPQIRFHDLRHTTVSLLISMGVPPSVVQSIVGHATALLTLDVYTHIQTEDQEEAMKKMGNLFG